MSQDLKFCAEAALLTWAGGPLLILRRPLSLEAGGQSRPDQIPRHLERCATAKSIKTYKSQKNLSYSEGRQAPGPMLGLFPAPTNDVSVCGWLRRTGSDAIDLRRRSRMLESLAGARHG